MAFPTKWGNLHLRLANMIRDRVATADLDGRDLTYADRNSYLNEAYETYLGLFNASYRNDTEFITSALSSMVKTGNVSIVSGTASSLPSDYGVFLKLSKSGVSVTKETAEGYQDVKDGRIPHKVPSSTVNYCLPKSTTIEVLPATVTDLYTLVYIVAPISVTYTDGATDIPLDPIHFRSILAFAAELIYNDKFDFDLAASFRKRAFELAPYKLNLNG